MPSAPGVSVQADRRFRRTDASVDRRRRTRRIIWRIARWTLPSIVVALTGVWLGRALLASDALQVRDIAIEGTRQLSSADVERLVDGLRGQNILKVDFHEYERRMLSSPWIADVTLYRALPARVRIHVVERVPLAIARIDRGLYLVDRMGVVMAEYGPAHRELDLPLVDGLTDAKAAGGAVVPERIRLAYDCLTALEAAPELRQRLSELNVSDPHDAVVVVDDDSALLHLGTERFVERLQGYLDLRPALRTRYHRIDYVDLRFDDRVYLNGTGVMKPVHHPSDGQTE